MRRFPEPIQTLMAAFTRLPGVGPKTALRYVYTLLALPAQEREYLARAITKLEEIKICPTCFTHTELDVCELCKDPNRKTDELCVVSESRDISTIESTKQYQGQYHVLGGLLNPIEGVTHEHIRSRELVERLKNSQIQEVILAISPDVQGEMTIMQLTKILKPFEIKVTRLARGLPMGASLEFSDEVTLSDAFSGRRET